MLSEDACSPSKVTLNAALANINYDSMNFDGINVDISANDVIARSIKADGTNSDLELQSISADIIELKSVNLTAEIVNCERASAAAAHFQIDVQAVANFYVGDFAVKNACVQIARLNAQRICRSTTTRRAIP